MYILYNMCTIQFINVLTYKSENIKTNIFKHFNFHLMYYFQKKKKLKKTVTLSIANMSRGDVTDSAEQVSLRYP